MEQQVGAEGGEGGNQAGNSSGLWRRVILLALLVAGVTLLIWAGVHNRRDRMLAQQREQNTVRLDPSASAGGAAATADSSDDSDLATKLQGKPAPAFSLVDLNGHKVSLADYRGKPVLVNFWATWCGPCKLEMPWLEEFSRKYSAQGFTVLGVAADDAPKNIIASVVNRAGVTYPVLLKDSKVEDLYGGVEYLPESFYVGRDGKVMLATAGLTSENGGKDEIEANIRKLLAQGGQ